MSAAFGNISRISFNQRMFALRGALEANQTAMYRVQRQLGTNLKFELPSDDPLSSQAATRLERTSERLNQVRLNVQRANSVLTDAESSAQDAVDLLSEARSLGLSAVGDSTTPDERKAVATVVRSLLDQIVAVANRQHDDVYLFSGRQNLAPFEFAYGGVMYTGDGDRRETMVESDGSVASFTIPGASFFAGVSSEVRGVVDLDPAVTDRTLLASLDGAAGRGVRLGNIVVNADGDQRVIDLSSVVTVGDVIDRLNAELPGGMQAALIGSRIVLNGGGGRSVDITDMSGGFLAKDLGLAGMDATDPRVGGDLQARLTNQTPISVLRAGAGLDLSAGFVIRNGGATATIDLSRAATIEDALNAINHADAGVWARISDNGMGIDIVSRISGVDFTIEETTGQTATLLGVRSTHSGTLLASLNGGLGVQTAGGDDLRITTRSGATVDVDLDGLTTIQDVIDRLNTAGGGQIVAGLASNGNGIRIVDNTAGGGTFAIAALNNSLALVGLGLDVAASGDEIVGKDVNPKRVDSPFTGLSELRDALEVDDRLGIQRATERIERVLENLQRQQGQMASVARTMSERADRIDVEASAAEVMLSDVRDADFTDLAIRFQQLQTALQANLGAAGKVLNLSLLDYLR